MEVVALGVASGVAYGASDFLGGMASRRVGSSLPVVALFTFVAALAFAVTMPFAGAAPTPGAAGWGVLAGVAAGAGYLGYFRGLVHGSMGVVATIAAVWSAVVPLAAGVALGERFSGLAWAGMVAILVAIALITYTRAPAYLVSGEGRRPAAGLLEATGAGLGFGLFFVFLAQAGEQPGGLAWPLMAAAAVAALVVGAVAAGRRVRWRPAARQWRPVLGAGFGYAVASWSFIAGASRGSVAIVAVLAALSPVPTMLLARVALGESLRARQYAGIALALAGVALISVTSSGA